MPSLLGDRAAQWLRERMDSGDWKTVPRRINHTSANGGGDGDGCVLASVDSYYHQTGVFEATIWTFNGDGSASGKKVKVICPTMSGITRIASGEVVILHKCQMDEYEGEEVGGEE